MLTETTLTANKTCRKCQIEKPETDFYLVRGKRRARCKACESEYNAQPYVRERIRNSNRRYQASEEGRTKAKEYRAEYNQRPERKEKNRERSRIFRNSPEGKAKIEEYRNLPDIKQRERARSSSPEYVEKRRAYEKRPEQREKVRRYERERARNDPDYRIRRRVSTAVRRLISKPGVSTFSLLPYTAQELREHLESQFIDGMSWENYGFGWHIDHILPLSGFDMEDPLQFQAAWALTNLWPLWAHLNISKNANAEYVLPENWREVPDYARVDRGGKKAYRYTVSKGD